MKTTFLFLLLLSLSACQHSTNPVAEKRKVEHIDYYQLQSYLQHTETNQWSSRARSASLGGRAPYNRPAPTFRMGFSEAMSKARILDVRPREDFEKYNLGMEDTAKTPVINIPAPEILEETSKENLQAKLKNRGIELDSILIVICNKGVRSPVVAQRLSDQGYPRVANYAGGYKEVKSCADEEK